jgi:shikimate dehydrogenase
MSGEAGDPNKIVTGGWQTVGRYAVIGHPVAHSKSPALHNAWFQAAGLPWKYEAVDVPEADLVRRGPSLPFEFAGCNVTAPLKVDVLGYVDHVDADAERAGAANLLYRDPDRAWTAGNTDGAGFLRALEEATGETMMGRDVVVLGAGGAARAIGAAVADASVASLVLAARDLGKAGAVAEIVGATGVERLSDALFARLTTNVDLVVNTLPIAADELLSALDLRPLPEHAVVVDINYWAERPAILVNAEAAGLLALDGRGMFLFQAALSFERWTGQAPELDIGRQVLGM